MTLALVLLSTAVAVLAGALVVVCRAAAARLEEERSRSVATQDELKRLQADEIGRLVGATVVVHTNAGRVRGILQGAYRDVLSLADAEFISSSATQAFSGTVHIPRPTVQVVQTLASHELLTIRELGDEG